MASGNSSSATRIASLLDHLGLDHVHVGACMSGDWGGLVTSHGERVRSLVIVAPHLNKGIPAGLDTCPTPTLVVCGDQGVPAKRGRDLAKAFRNASAHELRDYTSPMWADTVADRTDAVSTAVAGFIEAVERELGSTDRPSPEGEGEIAGLHYRIEGVGPPLLLLPLSLAPSQWSPLIVRLKDRYCTITVDGPHVGMISLLEARGQSGYGRLINQLVNLAEVRPGNTVLEVGSGSGYLARTTARNTKGANPITATEINGYLLAQARALARAEGLEDTIRFEQGNAESLPYPDVHFDVAMSCTVLEEGDADRMLAELARVTKPTGRVLVVTRAIDISWWVNVPMPSDLASKVNAYGPSTGSGAGVAGCADASLYRRLSKVGLAPIMMGPQFAVYTQGARLRDVLERFVVPLSGEQVKTFRAGIEKAEGADTLFVAEPFHCAIGVKH